MIDISYDILKSTGSIPHWFGLGFVQLKLNYKQRIHFWHPDFRPIVDDVHNHRYSFTSQIIAGEMIHETWSYEPCNSGKTECLAVSCQPGQMEEQHRISIGTATMHGRYTLTKGSKYFMTTKEFHRTFAKRAVTILCRGEIECDNALVLRNIGQPSVCPFSKDKSETECWEIIKELLG